MNKNAENKLISIVIPVYNEQETIHEMVSRLVELFNSVIRNKLEVIIISGC